MFSCPLYYLNHVGVYESIVLKYLMNSSNKNNIARFIINKSDIQKINDLKPLSNKDNLSKAMDRLFNMGFVFYHLKSGKKKRTFSICAMNIVLFEVFGFEKYMSMLTDYQDRKYIGKFIPYSYIESEPDDLKFGCPTIFDKYKYVVKYDIKKVIKSIYGFNFSRFKRMSIGERYVSESDLNFFTIDNILLFGKPMIQNFEEAIYDSIFSGFIKKENIIEDEESNSDEPEYEDPREKARNDLQEYYSYMKIREVMKKPIADWTPKDFVSYIYCGMAKDNGVGDFVFPDFAKDSASMRRAMEKYGNRRLSKIINALVKNKYDIMREYNIKEIRLGTSILFVDWIIDKVILFIEKNEEQKVIGNLTEKIINHQKKQAECQLSDNKLDELRKNFNKEKSNG